MLKTTVIIELLIGAFFALAWTEGAVAADEKQLFMDQKCTRCHSISALDIAKKSSADAEEGEDSGSKPLDLSDVGKHHDLAFFVSYLKKEVEHPAHAGNADTKKHKLKFKGTDEELTRMATWLASLKLEPKK